MDKVRVGIVGCGVISDIYIKNILQMFSSLDLLGVCDINDKLAEEKTKNYSLKNRYYSYQQMLEDRDIEIIVNLTPPNAHFSVTKAALDSMKHVYSEKPLSSSFSECKELISIAEKNKVQIGCSPDTFLGASFQTCRKLIEDNFIGDIIGFTANLVKPGVETWHPNPAFLYKQGAGPIFDMGPYYLCWLIQLLGPISSVFALEKKTFPTRTITSQPLYGTKISVEVPTHVVSLIEFDHNIFGTFLATFDVSKAELPYIEIYGTTGTLSLPNPNDFSGKIRLFCNTNGQYLEMPNLFDYSENCRGLGLADMAYAIRTGNEIRANSELALHIVEVLEAIILSGDLKKALKLETTCHISRPMLIQGKNFEI